MTQIYDCMLLINNDAVRAGWADVKSAWVGTIEKHGGKVLSARHWDERRLAYPIRHRNRATYLRTFCELPPKAVGPLSNELNISERVLRYLMIKEAEVPAEELELSSAEESAEFNLPEPPDDDAVEQEETGDDSDREGERPRTRSSSSDDDSDDDSDDSDDDDDRAETKASRKESSRGKTRGDDDDQDSDEDEED